MKMKTDTIIAAVIIIFFQALFIITVVRNMIQKKSLVEWLFPDGTTRSEKIVLILSIMIILSVMVFWP